MNPRLATSNIGITRRLEALAAIGWAADSLAPMLGMSANGVRALRSGVKARPRAVTVQWVTELYRDLQGTPGPSEHARRHAARKGWPPPLAWEDIDDPSEQPVRVKHVAADGMRRWQASSAQDVAS